MVIEQVVERVEETALTQHGGREPPVLFCPLSLWQKYRHIFIRPVRGKAEKSDGPALPLDPDLWQFLPFTVSRRDVAEALFVRFASTSIERL